MSKPFISQGSICISLCAATVDELIMKIGDAEDHADMLELRFDCLNDTEFDCENPDALTPVLQKIYDHRSDTPWIATFRPKDQGGYRVLSLHERMNFWNSGFEAEFVDLEEDIAAVLPPGVSTRICSFHDFQSVPDDLELIFTRLSRTGAEIIKIAAAVTDSTDALDIWKLFELAKEADLRLIPIGMGEAGKWTRILCLAYGAPIAYASFDDAGRTAPGQISAGDLKNVFRVKELDRETLVYGVIAGDTSYSLSPYMHNAAFRESGLNSVFMPLQVGDLAAFMRRMVKRETCDIDLNFHGFSVTNPHKRSIMDHLDAVDPTARKIGAVNTVKIENGKLHGFNTDAPGFIAPLKKRLGDLKGARAAVAGSGGAARACIAALQDEGVDVTVRARDPKKLGAIADEFGVRTQALHGPFAYDIFVNATPLGTKGETEDQTLLTAPELSGVRLVYDLVYNPEETRLIREAKAAGIETLGGLEMLIAQGAHQFEIWTGKKAPVNVMESAIRERLS